MESSMFRTLLNPACPVCDDKVRLVDCSEAHRSTRGKDSIPVDRHLVDDFDLSSPRLSHWTLELYLHGRHEETPVSIFDLQLAGTRKYPSIDMEPTLVGSSRAPFGRDRISAVIGCSEFSGDSKRVVANNIFLGGFLVCRVRHVDGSDSHTLTASCLPIVHIAASYTPSG